MNIMKVNWVDVINGEGLRLSIFTAGCNIHCKGCFNKQSWDFNAGEPFTKELQQKILNRVSNPKFNYSGISLLGGEPSHHCDELTKFLKEFKNICPDKNVWIWTGYDLNLFTYKVNKEFLDLIDIIVAGPYIEEKRDLNLKFRGSTNQKIFKVEHEIELEPDGKTYKLNLFKEMEV